jgi:hypothetical protein
MEIAIGITCGNLPLLRPIFRHFFDSKSGSSNDYRLGYPSSGSQTASRKIGRPDASQLESKNRYRADGFERMDEESLGDGSQIELHDRGYQGDGIVVTTNIHIEEQETGGRTRIREMVDPLREPWTGSVEAARNGALPSVKPGNAL